MMKVSDIQLRAQAIELARKGYFCPVIVWGWPEDNVPRADQMKFSPSVMVWGGMM